MDDRETVQMVGLIASLWPNAPAFGDHHVTAYHMMLSEFPADIVQEALKTLAIQGAAHYPSPPQLRARVDEILAPVPEWGAAWAEVTAWIRAHGWPDPPTEGSFSHRAVFVAVERMGYEALCTAPTDGVGTTRAQFRQVYEGAVSDGRLAPARERVMALAGAGPIGELAARLKDDERDES